MPSKSNSKSKSNPKPKKSKSKSKSNPKITYAYCVKCKKKCKMANPKKVTLKNGRKALKGECVNCKVMMFRFLSKTETETK